MALELAPGLYIIAGGCRAVIREGKVVVSKKREGTFSKGYRCGDCLFFDKGYTTGGGKVSSVCKARKKKFKNYAPFIKNKEVYYSAYWCNKACEKFKIKITE